MSMSVRQQFALLGITDLSAGIRSKLSPFYQTHPTHFPYKPDGAQASDQTISVLKLIKAFNYPVGGFIGSYAPNNSGTPQFSEECQGITAGPSDWFITTYKAIFTANPTRLYRVPFTGDLGSSSSWNYVEVPSGLSAYDHFGDPVYYTANGESFVLVPCDGKSSEGRPDIVMRFVVPTTGAPVYRDSAILDVPNVGQLTAWSGFDPVTNLYYATEFCKTEGLVVHCFRIDYNPLKFDYLGGIPIRRTNSASAVVFRVQGGASAPSSHLWLVSDTRTADGGGLRCIELATGTLFGTAFQMSGDYQSEGVGCVGGSEWEYEGVCFADMDLVAHNPNLSGQLHWISLRNDLLSDDNVTIAHFGVALPSQKPWI